MKRKEEKKIRKLYCKRSRSLQCCCVRYMRASARRVLCCVRTAICSTNLVVSCRTIQCPLHCRIAWISLFDSLLLAASVVAVAEVLRCSFHFRSDHFRWNTLIFFRSRFVFRFVCSAAALVSERGCHSVRYGVRDSTYHNGFCDQWIFCVYAFSLNELKQHFLREREQALHFARIWWLCLLLMSRCHVMRTTCEREFSFSFFSFGASGHRMQAITDKRIIFCETGRRFARSSAISFWLHWARDPRFLINIFVIKSYLWMRVANDSGTDNTIRTKQYRFLSVAPLILIMFRRERGRTL